MSEIYSHHDLADSQNILNRRKKYFPQLFNVHSVSDVRQIEMHTAETIVPDLSLFEHEISIAKLKNINRQVLIKFRQN
jgi:hypothetical protein